MNLRQIARRIFLTSNTIRYRIEYRCVLECFRRAGNQPGSLLDAGAGSGEMSVRLFRDGFCRRATGVEPFEGNFQLLRENYRAIPESRAIQCGLEKIPLGDGEMDCVLSTQVLEHIRDDRAAAGEISRVLKPGGAAVISVPHPPEILPNPDHMRPGYTEEELAALFRPFGLALVHAEYFFTLPTLRRLIAAAELPLGGKFLPIGWADRESQLSNAERKTLQPYGICCLFRKDAP